MNLDKLISIAAAVVIGAAAVIRLRVQIVKFRGVRDFSTTVKEGQRRACKTIP